jgi:hypothetical protein
MTAPEVTLFWREPHLATLATITPDGTPHARPLWYLQPRAGDADDDPPDRAR